MPLLHLSWGGGGVTPRFAQQQETSIQAVARLAAICESLADDTGHIDFALARQKLRSSMPQVADSQEFLGMLRFVVTLGASRAPFIPDLKMFAGTRGQNRHLKPAAFALAGQLPATIPHVITGVIIMALTAPVAFFVDGFSRYLTAADTRQLVGADPTKPTEPAQKAESILKFFHRTCGKVLGKLSDNERLDLLCSVDSMVCRFITGKHLGKRQDTCPTLEHVAQEFFEELQGKLASKGVTMPPAGWQPPAPVAKPTALAGTGSKRDSRPVLQPRLQRFDEELVPQVEQDEFQETITTEEIDWAATLQPASLLQEMERARVLLAVHEATSALARHAADKVVVRRASRGDIRVVATKDAPRGTLAFAPAGPGMGCISVRRENASYPATTVAIGDMVLAPASKLPPRGVTVASWDKGAFVNPFWLMERSPILSRTNFSFVEVEHTAVTQLALGAEPLSLAESSTASRETLRIPILVNHKDVLAGEVCVVETEPPEKRQRAGRQFKWDTVKR